MINTICLILLWFNDRFMFSFRAWSCLTAIDDSSAATKWLEAWLRSELDLKAGISQKRLACAALVRVLLWEDDECTLDLSGEEEDDEPILASVVGFDVKFLAELSHACVGLIQSIPPQLQSESELGDLINPNASAIFSFEVDSRHFPLDGTAESSSA